MYIIRFCHKIQYIISSERNESIYLWAMLRNLLEIYFQNTHKIGRKLYENVVQNLVAVKDQHCPVYPNLLLKFVKLDSLLMHQDMSMLVQCVVCS